MAMKNGTIIFGGKLKKVIIKCIVNIIKKVIERGSYNETYEMSELS